jgi:alpha-glucuronidase
MRLPNPRAARLWVAGIASALAAITARSEDGYRLWLRYDRIEDAALRADDSANIGKVIIRTPSGTEGPTLAAARDELTAGLRGLLGADVPVVLERLAVPVPAEGQEGYELDSVKRDGAQVVTLSSESDTGALYGSFALLRHIQTGERIGGLHLVSSPKIGRRMLDHWDNLDGSIERGYAGASLWNWSALPGTLDPRYRDYARACASVGINGTVLTNVNANALLLTRPYIERAGALADVVRPYGVRVYLPAKFTAPMELGGLRTADPMDPAVSAWWRERVREIYSVIPDFGGFLVKANSEGQPGPQDYGRTHADGANMLADVLAPYHGIVLWRAFVYRAESGSDRVNQAYQEFRPLDGRFRDNVVLQIKNGPLDFMPREPFHPLFGAMPRTSLGLELQITQEYLGQGIQLAYLGTLWKEVLDANTFRPGPGSTVATVVDGSRDGRALTAIAGVANTGSDRNWTGHPLSQANWYAFGRLAWDHELSAEAIAREWVRMTYGRDPKVVETLTSMLMGSREAVVDYSMPLGLHHIMAEGHHYGPGPWDKVSRPDWTPATYHQADAAGIGANRSASGSNAIACYAPELAARWGSLETCPENLLLWFHHVPWGRRMRSGHTLWDELCLTYQSGVDQVRAMRRSWDSLQGRIDPERFTRVRRLLALQEAAACDWRDGCLLYFQQFSGRPIPPGVEAASHPLAYYEAASRSASGITPLN